MTAGSNYDLTVTPGTLTNYHEGDHRDRRFQDEGASGLSTRR